MERRRFARGDWSITVVVAVSVAFVIAVGSGLRPDGGLWGQGAPDAGRRSPAGESGAGVTGGQSSSRAETGASRAVGRGSTAGEDRLGTDDFLPAATCPSAATLAHLFGLSGRSDGHGVGDPPADPYQVSDPLTEKDHPAQFLVPPSVLPAQRCAAVMVEPTPRQTDESLDAPRPEWVRVAGPLPSPVVGGSGGADPTEVHRPEPESPNVVFDARHPSIPDRPVRSAVTAEVALREDTVPLAKSRPIVSEYPSVPVSSSETRELHAPTLPAVTEGGPDGGLVSDGVFRPAPLSVVASSFRTIAFDAPEVDGGEVDGESFAITGFAAIPGGAPIFVLVDRRTGKTYHSNDPCVSDLTVNVSEKAVYVRFTFEGGDYDSTYSRTTGAHSDALVAVGSTEPLAASAGVAADDLDQLVRRNPRVR